MTDGVPGVGPEAFGISPDPQFLYLDGKLRRERDTLLSWLESGIGVVVVDGVRGIGKTMLLRSLAAELREAGHTVAYLSCLGSPSSEEVMAEFGAQVDRPKTLMSVSGNDREGTILFLDDVDSLTANVLEDVLALPRDHAIQGGTLSVVFAGSRDLPVRMEGIRDPALQQQGDLRISLTPLKPRDVEQYILHRLHVAGCAQSFSPEAIDRITLYAAGNRQAINRICRAAMVIARDRSSEFISGDMVDQVAPGGRGRPQETDRPRHGVAPSARGETSDKAEEPGHAHVNEGSLHQSTMPKSIDSVSPFALTLSEQQSISTSLSVSLDGIPAAPRQTAAPETPSGREMVPQAWPDAKVHHRRRGGGPRKAVWGIVGLLSVVGAVAIYFVVSQKPPHLHALGWIVPSSSTLQSDQGDVLQTGSLISPSPRQWVEPPHEDATYPSYSAESLDPAPLVPAAQDLPVLDQNAGEMSAATDMDHTIRRTKFGLGDDARHVPPEGPTLAQESPGSAAPDLDAPINEGSAVQTSDISSRSIQQLELDRLLAKGDRLLGLGDVASARLVYRLAALEGSANAATSMASTYDPAFLETAGIEGTRPNPAEAIKWYRKALSMGAKSAEVRLRELAASIENGPVPRDLSATRKLDGS